MRKFVLAAAAAAGLLAASQQRASAWCSFKCIVGVGISCEKGSPCDCRGCGFGGPAFGGFAPASGGPPPGCAQGGGPVGPPRPAEFSAAPAVAARARGDVAAPILPRKHPSHYGRNRLGILVASLLQGLDDLLTALDRVVLV